MHRLSGIRLVGAGSTGTLSKGWSWSMVPTVPGQRDTVGGGKFAAPGDHRGLGAGALEAPASPAGACTASPHPAERPIQWSWCCSPPEALEKGG